MLFLNKMTSAAKRGITFSLKLEDIYWPEYCSVLGLELNYSRKGKAVEDSPSFDRVDPSQGYTPENTRIISTRANRIKNDGSASEHRRIADWLDSRVT